MTTPHRGGACTECYGDGVDIHKCEHPSHDSYGGDVCPHCPECDACDGFGQSLWAWHPDIAPHQAKCSGCGVEGVETMGTGEDGEVCLACLRRRHAERCGCDLWDEPAERWAAFYVRPGGRPLYLVWHDAETLTGFVETSKGGYYGTLETQPGPALSSRVNSFATREEAEALLVRARVSGKMSGLIGGCRVDRVPVGVLAGEVTT